MSSMRLGAEGIGATGGICPASHTDDEDSRPRLAFRSPVATIAVTAALMAAAAGGGFVGYEMAAPADSAFLSGTANGEAAAYQATAPNVAVRTAVERVRSNYQGRLAAMGHERERLRAELERARARHADAQRDLDRISVRLAALRTGAARDGAEALGDAEAMAEARRALNELRLELAAAESEKESLTETLGALAGTMGRVIAERDDAAARARSLREHVATLSEEQDRLMGQLEQAARASLGGMRDMFERAGVDLDRILGETRVEYTGSGGPFEPITDGMSEATEATEQRVAALMTSLEEVSLMRFAAKQMPFGMPVEGTRLTSGFGGRHDPLGRGRGMHEGIDLAGPRGTPILATAEGVVTFSGSQRGYGRIVIIRHAFGFETRYAHLNRSHVKVGERVERGDHIADMGNTGRSTGTHLHYEVRIDREAVNPANFIEVAHDVL